MNRKKKIIMNHHQSPSPCVCLPFCFFFSFGRLLSLPMTYSHNSSILSISFFILEIYNFLLFSSLFTFQDFLCVERAFDPKKAHTIHKFYPYNSHALTLTLPPISPSLTTTLTSENITQINNYTKKKFAWKRINIKLVANVKWWMQNMKYAIISWYKNNLFSGTKKSRLSYIVIANGIYGYFITVT